MGPAERWLEVPNCDLTLAVRSFGGSGEVLLFLHGLAGHSEEWTTVAHSLTDRFRVIALDLRGHGRSDRHPTDVSPDAYCSDVLTIAHKLTRDGSLHLVGQSFGGHVAFLVASRNPTVFRSLTVIEADPDGPNRGAVDDVARWFSSWPRPFCSRAEAIEFFGSGPSASAWADGLEKREDGYWPRFDDNVLLEALAQVATRSWWQEWEQVVCRTLVVRGERGQLSADLANRMASAIPRGSVTVIGGAGHDVHLDQPETLTSELRRFLF